MEETKQYHITREVYLDEQGCMRIVRPLREMAKANAEYEAKQKEKEKSKKVTVQIAHNGKLFTGPYAQAFRDLIMAFGWERVRNHQFDVFDKPLITQDHPTKHYRELADGWYVNTNMRPKTMQITAYHIAKMLGETIVITW